MINIKDKSNCCGCNACAQKCPKQCISMREDDEGFLYPYVDKTLCIECGLCEKTCPIINSKEERKPLNVFAAKNQNDEVRMQSSSGGIFTLLAENVIDEEVLFLVPVLMSAGRLFIALQKIKRIWQNFAVLSMCKVR